MTHTKISRKELLKSPDRFLTTSEKVFNWLQANYRAASLVAGVVLALVLGYSVFSWHKNRQMMAIMEAYNQASFLLSEGQPEEAEKALEKLRLDYPRSGPARFALLDLSRMSQERGEIGRALELTHQFLEALQASENSLKPFVFDRLGSLYEIDGQFGKAGEFYRKTIDFPTLKESGLLSLARVLKSQGQNEEALKIYEQLLLEYPASRNLPLVTYNIALLSPGPVSGSEPEEEAAGPAEAVAEESGEITGGEPAALSFSEEDLAD